MSPSAAELCWVAGILLGVLVATSAARRSGLDERWTFWAAAAALLGGEVGALLLGVLDYGWDGDWNPLSRGKSFCGGLVLGGLVAVLLLRRTGRSVLAHGDALVTGLAAGYAVARVGCFLNGCDFGTTSGLPWAVRYPPGTEAFEAHRERGWIGVDAVVSLPVHPVQVYAALSAVAILAVLLLTPGSVRGVRLARFAVLYGVTRYSLEFLRGDFVARLWLWSVPQVVSLCLVGLGLVLTVRRMGWHAVPQFQFRGGSTSSLARR